MKKIYRFPLPLLVTLLIALTFSGCSRESKKTRYLEQADRAFASDKYDLAEIDYKNALKIENLNPRAISRLALIYADQGRIGQAIPYVLKGREIQPNNLELRLKFAQLNLATGNLKDARAEAYAILERHPTNPDAPVLLTGTIARPQDITEVRTRLEGLPAPTSSGAPVLTALGMIELLQGHIKEGEALLQKALVADPKFAAAHSALGTLYGLQNDKIKALQSFKLAAEESPARSPRRLQYAQFLITSGDANAGTKYLEEMTRATPDFLSAWTMLAEFALMDKQYKTCASYIDKIIARDGQNLEALFIRGRLQLAQGNTTKGVEEFTRLANIYPRAPQVHYQLGLAYLAANNATQAMTSLKQALSLTPGQVDTIIALANLHQRTGDPSAAIVLLKPLIQQRPKFAQAKLLLAECYRTQKNFDEALKIYRQIEKDFPGNAQTSLMTGLVFLQQNQSAEAREFFNEALERMPGLIPALERLVALDIVDKKFDAATQRVETELAKNPNSAGLHVLLAKICMAKADTARAETEFRKAIELQPDGTEAYYLLAQLYIGNKEEQKALANLQTIVSQNPKDVSALMLIALIKDQQKNYAEARDAYEKILAVNPKFTNALNNVAYLYSEHFNEPEKALAAAQKARELLPQEPHVADTLAWILFKKGQYRWALSLLEESAAKLPDEPEIQYHLGLTRYMLSQEEPARLALQHALDAGKDFTGIDEAKNRIALLSIDPRTADAEARALLEKTLVARPNDPVALTRLAALQERDGAIDKAIATLMKAVQANPNTATPLINLARLHAINKNTAQALEMAKAARKIAPDDPDTTHILGQIAYQAGDYNWSASLLQEAAQKITDNPEWLYDEAEALYSIGRVADAEASMRGALSLSETKPTATANEQPMKPFGRTKQANRFLEMLALSSAPAPAETNQVDQLLKTEPDYVPALMAAGTLSEQRSDSSAARIAYEKALARFPDFFPAKVRVAILGAAQPAFDRKAFELAQQARVALPNDPELAKALGILVYRKGGEASRAVTLLKQSALARPTDAELLYYLGMAQFQAKDQTGGRQSLQKSLEAGLRQDLAAEARKALAGSK